MSKIKRLFLQRKATVIGMILVSIVVIAALGAGLFTRFEPDEMNVANRLLAP